MNVGSCYPIFVNENQKEDHVVENFSRKTISSFSHYAMGYDNIVSSS